MKKLVFTSRAEKNRQKIDSKAKSQIIGKLQEFRNNNIEVIPLTGSWKNWFKY